METKWLYCSNKRMPFRSFVVGFNQNETLAQMTKRVNERRKKMRLAVDLASVRGKVTHEGSSCRYPLMAFSLCCMCMLYAFSIFTLPNGTYPCTAEITPRNARQCCVESPPHLLSRRISPGSSVWHNSLSSLQLDLPWYVITP